MRAAQSEGQRWADEAVALAQLRAVEAELASARREVELKRRLDVKETHVGQLMAENA